MELGTWGIWRWERRGDVQRISDDAEGEDCDGEGVAAVARVTAEEARYEFVVVFCSGWASGCQLESPWGWVGGGYLGGLRCWGGRLAGV